MVKFPARALELIRCPHDGGQLHCGEKGNLSTGEVICTQNPDHRFFINDGILSLLPAVGGLGEVKISEIEARDRQARDYDKRLASRYAKEMPSMLKAIGSLGGKRIVEYGCGTGRLTVELLGADLIVAADFSLSSLKILSTKLAAVGNVTLVHCDVSALKLFPESFDLAVSAQVIEHIPSNLERLELFRSIKLGLRPKGKLVLTAYHYDHRRHQSGKGQEGKHQSGIFYHYFKVDELVSEIRPYFKIEKINPIDITLPGEAKLNLPANWGGRLSRWSENFGFLNRYGHLVLVQAVKRDKAVHYRWGLVGETLLSKHWYWFSQPFEVAGAAMTNFFSYVGGSYDGFSQRSGLTTVVDLRKDLDGIWSAFRASFIQKQIRRGQRNGIVVVHDQNFASFEKLYARFREGHGLPRENLRPLRSVGEVFLARYGEKLIAGGLFIHNGTTMRAWALSSLVGKDDFISREIIGQANRMVIWEAIQYAKFIGCEEFDLGGISPDSPNPHLRSLAEFKEAFGGVRRAQYYYFKIYSPLIRWWMKLRGFKNV